jgi:hypothetical protein
VQIPALPCALQRRSLLLCNSCSLLPRVGGFTLLCAKSCKACGCKWSATWWGPQVVSFFPSLITQRLPNLGLVKTTAFLPPPSPEQAASNLEEAISLLRTTSQAKTGNPDAPVMLVMSDMQSVMVGVGFHLGNLDGVLGPQALSAVLTRSLADTLSLCVSLYGNLRPVLSGATSVVGQTLHLGDDLTVISKGTSPALSTPDEVRRVLQNFLAMSQLGDDFIQGMCQRLAGLWALVPEFIGHVARLGSDLAEPTLVTCELWTEAETKTFKWFSKHVVDSLGVFNFSTVRVVNKALAAFLFTEQLRGKNLGGGRLQFPWRMLRDVFQTWHACGAIKLT